MLQLPGLLWGAAEGGGARWAWMRDPPGRAAVITGRGVSNRDPVACVGICGVEATLNAQGPNRRVARPRCGRGALAQYCPACPCTLALGPCQRAQPPACTPCPAQPSGSTHAYTTTAAGVQHAVTTPHMHTREPPGGRAATRPCFRSGAAPLLRVASLLPRGASKAACAGRASYKAAAPEA